MQAWKLCSLLGLTVALTMGCGGGEEKKDEKKKDEKTTATKPVNLYCPIMDKNKIEEVTADTPTVQWDGKTIAFCCPGCDEKFLALSEEEKAAALARSIAQR